MLWTCNLWTFGIMTKTRKEDIRIKTSCGLLFFRYTYFSFCQTRDTHTHIPHGHVWCSCRWHSGSPAYMLIYVCVCVCVRVFVLVKFISVELIRQGCVILHSPLWCIQHRLYACMYLCIMDCVKCIRIYSLYVLIYSYSTWPLDFVIPLKVKLKKKWIMLHTG